FWNLDEPSLTEEAFARRVARDPPLEAVRAQLWATWLPLASDLATVALLWVAGVLVLRSRRAALALAFAFAVDPLAIFAASRVLSNSTLTTASLTAVLAWHAAEERDGRAREIGLALAGVVVAFAISVKVSAIFLLPAGVVAAFSKGRLRDR